MNESLRAAILALPATQGNLTALLSLAVEFAADPAFNGLRCDDIEAETGIDDVHDHLASALLTALDLRAPTDEERNEASYDRAHAHEKDATW